MDKLFIELLNLSIAASWMILAVLILRLVLKRAPKSLICALWLLVGLRLLLPVSVESALSLIPSRRTVSAAIAEPGTLPPVRVSGIQVLPTQEGGYNGPSQVDVIDSGLPALDSALNPVINESFAPEIGASVDPLQVLTALSGWVWLLGGLVLLGYGAFSFLRLKLRLRESVLAGPGVREGAMVDSPFVLGIFRPVIYLPLGLSERDREMVLVHERAHLKRRDNWVKPLAYILLAVHWFNPLMWLAYVLLCRDIEAACDERVLRDMSREERRAYSTALLNCSLRHRAIGACPLAFGELSVKGRIKSVLNYKKPGFWISLAALAACAVVAVCFLTDPVTEDENPQAGPESLAAEGESEAEGGLPEEDAQLLFVIPEEGEGADYAPPELGQIQMGDGRSGTWYVDLRMMSDLNSMLAACRSAGHQVEVGMAYTSYDDLQTMYGDMEMSDGTKSARSPISRERQTGLAVLLERRAAGDYDPAADSRQAQEEQAAWQETLSWLEENCAGFGFIQRFPPDKEQITGINGLENLFRYVGHGAAEYLGSRDLCLEEYLAGTEASAPAASETAVDASLFFIVPKEGEGSDYAPENLTQIREETEELPALYLDSRASESLERMLSDCRSAGHEVAVFRAYESYEETLEEIAESFSGEPQLSGSWDVYRRATKLDLQSGLSVILARLPDGGNYTTQEQQDQELMEQLRAGWLETRDWLNEHCGEYGFIQRFPEGKMDVTGGTIGTVFRYVGEPVAEYMNEQNLCLEEYLLIAADASIDSGYSLPQVEILGAYAQGEDYCCYVKLSELDPGYLSMDSGKLYINGLYTRPDGQPLVLLSNAGYGSELQAAVYDDRTESLTLCLFARDWKNSLGEGWPKEIELKMLVNGQVIPSLGVYQLPEPSSEGLSLRLAQPVEFLNRDQENPIRLLGAELYPCGAAWVLNWADYERYLEDNSNFNSLSQEEENWLAEQSMGYTSAQWQFKDSGLIYFADGSSLAFPAVSVSYGRDGGVLLNTEIFLQPIDLDSVTAVSLAGQMIEVK